MGNQQMATTRQTGVNKIPAQSMALSCGDLPGLGGNNHPPRKPFDLGIDKAQLMTNEACVPAMQPYTATMTDQQLNGETCVILTQFRKILKNKGQVEGSRINRIMFLAVVFFADFTFSENFDALVAAAINGGDNDDVSVFTINSRPARPDASTDLRAMFERRRLPVNPAGLVT